MRFYLSNKIKPRHAMKASKRLICITKMTKDRATTAVSHPCLVAERRYAAEVSVLSDICADIMQCTSLIFYQGRAPAAT